MPDQELRPNNLQLPRFTTDRDHHSGQGDHPSGMATAPPGIATTIPARGTKVVAFRLESVVAFDRNRWSPSIGTLVAFNRNTHRGVGI
jgi:hypothetical protein